MKVGYRNFVSELRTSITVFCTRYFELQHIDSCTSIHQHTPCELKNPVLIILKLWNFVCCLKYFHDKTTTNYHILGLRGCFHGLSWHAYVRVACFRTACFFVCLYMTCLCSVVLDHAIIVLDATCACGTPWTFLLTLFQDQDQDSLPVKRRNDNHSPGPAIRELVPSSHQRSNTILRTFSRWDQRIRVGIPIPDSLGEEAILINICISNVSLKCHRVLISTTPSFGDKFICWYTEFTFKTFI